MTTRTAVTGLQPGLYKHYKGGFYFVTDVNEYDSETGETRVRYWSLAHQHWVSRSRRMFCEEVEWPFGGMAPRFVPVIVSSIVAVEGGWRGFVDARGEQPNFLVEAAKVGA